MSSVGEQTLDAQPPGEADPPRRTGLGQHYARYSSATVMTVIAGLVSFPIMTRLLDNTQFGILGYYDTWLMMAVAVMKLGGQHAILRLYPFGAEADRLVHFTTNLVFLPMVVSIGLWLLALAGFGVAGALGAFQAPAVFWCALLLIPLLVFTSQVEMTLRASERSGLLTVSRIPWRWLELVLIVGVVAALERSALGAYAGKIAAALVLVAFYAHWVRRNLRFSRAALDFQAYRDSLRYGLPLVFNEIAGMSLISIDRIMLKHQLGDYAAVGVFTIGCALAMQVSVIMADPLSAAFHPVVNRVHGTEGDAEVRALKRRVMLPVTYASLGIGVAIWAVGADVLAMLAGTGKAASGPVFAWLGAMFALLPLLDLITYGLLLHKRSMTVLGLTAAAAAVNIALNLWWIPLFGVMGAVYATVTAYAAMTLGRFLLCPRGLMQLPEAKGLLIAGTAAALFAVAVQATALFDLEAPWARAVAAGHLWLLFYVAPILVADPRVRQWLRRGAPASA